MMEKKILKRVFEKKKVLEKERPPVGARAATLYHNFSQADGERVGAPGARP
jgi:hypothetical protein